MIGYLQMASREESPFQGSLVDTFQFNGPAKVRKVLFDYL